MYVYTYRQIRKKKMRNRLFGHKILPIVQIRIQMLN